jgi:uncharacterized protein YbjT (DUF2867 family)
MKVAQQQARRVFPSTEPRTFPRTLRLHILLTGANGFIGSALAAALLARGHTLICPRREPGRASPSRGATDASMRTFALDFADRPPPQAWRAALDGVDVVVNTVGILQERATQTFSALHVDAPIALFDAACWRGCDA